jgi:hypothetical protein
LTEAECWARCYGVRDRTITVSEVERRPGRPAVSGEQLRRLLEERIDARAQDEAEAA